MGAQEERPMEPLFPGLTCKKCGGSLTKVSEKAGVAEYVCMNNEAHRLKVKRAKTGKVKRRS